MLNRRQFLSAAATAATFVHVPRTFATLRALRPHHRGGRVIDSSVRLDGIRDIAISQGASPLWMPHNAATRLKPSTLVASWSSQDS